MSPPSLASACILGILLALPSAAALDAERGPARVSANAGPCFTLGDPPGSRVDVATGGCGPKVILRVVTPAGTVERDVGGCQDDCSVIVFVDIVLCSGPDAPDNVHGPQDPLDTQGGPEVDAEAILREVQEQMDRLHADPAGNAIEMETFLSCD